MQRIVVRVAWGIVLLGAAQVAAQSNRAKTAVVADHSCVDVDDKVFPVEALKRAQGLRVVFGHESVGFDVIHGLQGLSAADPERYRVTIQPQIQAAWFSRNKGLGEFFFHSNGNAAGKIDDFAQRVRGGFGDCVEVASMKLCYADMTERSDPQAIFDHWRETFEDLEKAYPKVRFVWWTVPVPQPSRLGEKRTAINDLIRAYVRENGKLLLDVADIESHTPEGEAVKHPDGSERLFADYGRDQGGHLNDDGAQRVGRAWWWLLARLAGWFGAK